MKKFTLFLIAALFALVAISATAVFAEDSEKWISGELKLGATVGVDDLEKDESGAKGGAEYNSSVGYGATTYIGGNLELSKNGFDFSADALYMDVDEQEYGGELSLKRVFIYKADYSRFLHRLDHDYMENLMAHIFPPASTGWKNWGSSPELANIDEEERTVGTANVYHTDLAEDEMFEIKRSLLNQEFKINIPQIPELKFSFNHRYEQRKGHKQAMTSSKCLSCHVVSRAQEINEKTNDLSPKLSLRLGTMAFEFAYMHREFEADNEDLTNVYNGIKGKELFLNRLQYDNTTGELPYSRTPDSTKDTYKGKFRWDINANNTFMANYVFSEATNKSVDGPYEILTGNYGEELDLTSSIFNARFHSRLTKAISINIFGKYQELDNDKVDIHKNVRRNPASAKYGPVTLKEGYINTSGWSYFEEDETRYSGYDSNTYEIGADITWRVMRGLKLAAGYEFKREKRDNYKYHNVTESTKEHIFSFNTDWRINHNLRFDFDYKFEYIDDPYMLFKASCTPDGSYGAYAGLPAGLYITERAYDPAIYSARTAARSNMPSQVHEVQLKSHWHPFHMLNTSFFVKYKYSQNDDVDGRDWQQDFIVAGFSGTLTPIKDLIISAGYTYMYDKYESQYCIAIYDG